MPIVPLFFFSPRGLITILLFLSIPVSSRIPLINEEVVTVVILMTIFLLMIGNIIHKREHITCLKNTVLSRKNKKRDTPKHVPKYYLI